MHRCYHYTRKTSLKVATAISTTFFSNRKFSASR